MEVEKARAMGGQQPLSSHFKKNESTALREKDDKVTKELKASLQNDL